VDGKASVKGAWLSHMMNHFNFGGHWLVMCVLLYWWHQCCCCYCTASMMMIMMMMMIRLGMSVY